MQKTFSRVLALVALAAAALPIATMAAAAGRICDWIFKPLDYLGNQLASYQPGQMILGANVLTDLAADIYKSADIVGRELVGIVSSVTLNAGLERAAVGSTVRSFATRPATVDETSAPASSMTIPEGTDQVVDNKTATIEKHYSVKIPWTGEDIKFVGQGSGWETVYGDQIMQAMRAIVNKIEIYMWTKMYQGASRAYGTAGTTPFASNFNVLPQLRKILVDNGMPFDGQVSVVMDTSAGANLRSLAQLQKANEAGDSRLLRQGTLLDLQGFMLKESAGIGRHTAGAATGTLINNASNEAIGQTTLTVDTVTVNTTGIKAGDIITHASDANNKYVVNTGLVATAGDIVIGSPGLLVAAANNDAVTIGGSYTANLAFHKAAAELAIRAPAMPKGGDAAVDVMMIQDPHSGLVFEIAAYKGYQKAMFDVRCVAGGVVWKSDAIATLLG